MENQTTTPESTAVAKKPAAQLTIRDRLEGPEFRSAVAKALPKHLTPDRFIRIASTAIMRTPKLAQCDQASFFAALLTLSQLGIEPDGRRAHLIPFENRKRGCTEVQLIIDYKGLVELAMRSGMVSNLHADIVCANDRFSYDTGKIEHHKINFMEPRGPVYAVYAIARFKDGSEKTDVMTVDEVEAIRSRSKAAQSGPWVTDWNEMAKKTVFRRLSKWLPLSPEFRDAIESDTDDTTIDISAATQSLDIESAPKHKPRLAKEASAPLPPPPEEESPVTDAMEPEQGTSAISDTPPVPGPHTVKEPVKAPAKTPEPVVKPKPTPKDETPEPTPPPEDDAEPEVETEYVVSTELAEKLIGMGVNAQSFDKWLKGSGSIDAFKADGVAASTKLLADERRLKKLQTLYGKE
jgi:recombination protein RecT